MTEHERFTDKTKKQPSGTKSVAASLMLIALLYAIRLHYPVIIDIGLSIAFGAVGVRAITRRQLAIAGKWGSGGFSLTGMPAVLAGLGLVVAGIVIAALALTIDRD